MKKNKLKRKYQEYKAGYEILSSMFSDMQAEKRNLILRIESYEATSKALRTFYEEKLTQAHQEIDDWETAYHKVVKK